MQRMEASFKSRVEQTFGALLGSPPQRFSLPELATSITSSSSGVAATDSWSVSDVAIPCNQGSKVAAESSGSDSDEPCAARFQKFVKLAKRSLRRQENDDEGGFGKEIDLDDLDEDRASKRKRGEDPEEPVSAGLEDRDEEEECRQVRLMVGKDDTLDFEEEEDEYDKVAVGREGAGDRVYMREITGVSDDMTPLPDSVPSSDRRRFRRDSRANHAAAVARLEEDDRLATIKNPEVARMLTLSSASGNASKKDPLGNGVGNNCFSHPGGSSSFKKIKPALKSSADIASNGKAYVESSKLSTVTLEGSISNGAPNEIALHRGSSKDGGGQDRHTENLAGQDESGITMQSKSKRVRFSEDDHIIVNKESVSGRDIQKVAAIRLSENRYARVPDHVRNPFKYTHYTLEWSDEEDDNRENLAAFQATQAMTRTAEEQETMGIVELPRSITFTPRSGGGLNKGNGEVKISTGAGFQQSQALVSFAEEILINDSPRPEEGSGSTKSASASTEAKNSRVFRKRAREEESDDNNSKDGTS